MSLDLAALEKPITHILTAPGTDLTSISAKQVRKALLGDPRYAFLRLTREVLRTRREDVDQLIARIFQNVNGTASSGGSKRKREEDEVEVEVEDDDDDEEEDEEAEVKVGGVDAQDGDGDDDEVEDRPHKTASSSSKNRKGDSSKKTKTKTKTKKKKKSVEEADAALARKLSSEINGRARRGASVAAGASSPRKAKRKTKKSAETVDSDEESKPKKRAAAKGGFAKEYLLSAPLSAVLEVEKLSRPQVVKKLWEYIRKKELQNPSNKKEIVCDDALHAVFAVDKIDMFRMNKVLGQHLHEP